MASYKLGKLPHKVDPRDLTLDTYLAKLPKVPKVFGHWQMITPSGWALLGNDRYGDCVWAGAAHETMLWDKLGHSVVNFTDANVLGDYAACTGFDPNDPKTDQGTDMRAAAKYRLKHGIADWMGQRHKIAAYVGVPLNETHVRAAAYLFEAVGLGIEFPDSAMDQFNAGQPWTPVRGANIEGGHYVPLVGQDNHFLYVVTWGKVQKMSWSFFDEYADEALCYLTPEDLVAGRSPEGFDLAALKSDLAALGH